MIDPSQIRRNVILGLVLAVILSAVCYYFGRKYYFPISKYGISYEISYGEHQEFQTISFYWDRGGRRIVGPQITGEDIRIRYRYRSISQTPDLLIVSGSSSSEFAVFRINSSESSKPEFQLLENHAMGIVYQAPWESYYHRRIDGTLLGSDQWK